MSELSLFLFIMNLSICMLIGVLLPILPLITRKSFLFGVKVPIEAQNTPEAKELKKNYVAVCLTGTAVLLALVISQYFFCPGLTLLAAMYFPVLFVAVQLLAFVPNWKRALRLKEECGWTVSDIIFADTKTSHTRGNLSDLPWFWYIASLVIIIAGVAVALIQYPKLPDKIPTHWNIDMVADAWSDKSYIVLLMMPLINLGMTVLMWFLAFMIVRAKLQIDPQSPALSFTQHKLYRRRMGHSLGFLTFCLVIMFAFLGFKIIWPDIHITTSLIFALTLFPTLPAIIVPIVSGQGGCKIKPKTLPYEPGCGATGEVGFINTYGCSDDKLWALGMFYHNPDDPACIVEDRFGSNLGFNYSRLPVKISVAVFVLALGAFYVWFTASSLWLLK